MSLRDVAAMLPAERDTFLSDPDNFKQALGSMRSDLGGMTYEEMMQVMTSLDDDPICKDSEGRTLCDKHKREVCQVCCIDHRVGNTLRVRFADRETSEKDIAAIQSEFYAESDAFHANMRARGIAVVGGTQRMQDLFDDFTGGRWAPSRGKASPKTQRMAFHSCAGCGVGGFADRPLLVCGRCRTVSYCSVDCQKQAWKKHKTTCHATTKGSA